MDSPSSGTSLSKHHFADDISGLRRWGSTWLLLSPRVRIPSRPGLYNTMDRLLPTLSRQKDNNVPTSDPAAVIRDNVQQVGRSQGGVHTWAAVKYHLPEARSGIEQALTGINGQLTHSMSPRKTASAG